MSDETKTDTTEKSKASKSSKKTTKMTAPAPVAVKVAQPTKRYSFDQWAARRGVPKRHRGGLRAFVKNPNRVRTLEDWDKCFENY